MKKFLTIALLVMALCVVSVAVSAAPTATASYDQNNKVATVTVTPETTGQTVVLVVNGANLTAIPNTNAPETLAEDIVYVDQATATAGTAVPFNFIPRADTATKTYSKDSTVFYSDGTTVGTPVALYAGAKYTVSFNMDGGVAIDSVEVREDATYTLPATAVKVGYEFKGWVDEKGAPITEVVKPGADVEVKATWAAYFEEDDAIDDSTHTNADFAADNSENKVADAGFVMNGEEKEYVVSVTATVAPTTKVIKGYGFYVYKVLTDGYSAPVIASKTGTIGAGSSFYAKATGIPETEVEAKIMFKPFIYDENNNVMWGKTATYSAKDLGADLKDITKASAAN